MECNKDEAAKAKQIAEKKLGEKDLMGAKKFALKAQSLYSGLDGLQQLLMTVNLYISAEKKINGAVDWYGVLGVDSSCSDEAVKKQYKKLALILHPDKNKSVGAEGAFKLLSEAWSLLSDKAKRTSYDEKRKAFDRNRTSLNGMYEKVIPTQNSSKSVGRDHIHPSVNMFNGSKNAPNPHLAPPKQSTFWTVCTNCKMQFEYVLQYLNKKLQCYNCKEPFLAAPSSPPRNTSQTPLAGHRPHVTSSHRSRNAFVSTSANGPVVYSGVVGSTPAYSTATNAKRANGGEPNGTSSVVKPRKRRRVSESKLNESGKMKSDQQSISGYQRSCNETEVTNAGTKGLAYKRELSISETRNIVVDKAREDILKKLNEWKNVSPKPITLNKAGKTAEAKNQEQERKMDSAMNSTDSETQASNMTVPDSDFHNFDNDRIENSFGDNQVWTAYDNDDGMPRYYALIHKVLSRKPFKMRISWLNSKSTVEFGDMNWTGLGFYKTNGDFRIGKYQLNNNVNNFSQRVKWTKGARGVICIYPCKGDVWALYKNWTSEWNENTSEESIHQYEMVEVLTDYNEEKGTTVIPLVKVAGFKTVFDRHNDQTQVRLIPKEEMFRFSHQVPSCLLTGKESLKAPKGCLELDPAAIPTELLQVIVEPNKDVPNGIVVDVAREDLPEVEKTQVKELMNCEMASDVRMMEDRIRAC